MVVISDSEIGSPFIGKADTALVMNDISFQKFKGRLKKDGLLVLNSSFVSLGNSDSCRVLEHPFTDLAIKLENIKVANMIALGCYLGYKRLLVPQTVLKLIRKLAAADKKELREINFQAFLAGMKLSR
jgi:2-oxoglutarate ferredoxin oxidoreductase subunit gamma